MIILHWRVTKYRPLSFPRAEFPVLSREINLFRIWHRGNSWRNIQNGPFLNIKSKIQLLWELLIQYRQIIPFFQPRVDISTMNALIHHNFDSQNIRFPPPHLNFPGNFQKILKIFFSKNLIFWRFVQICNKKNFA